jgi:hypothetical protein
MWLLFGIILGAVLTVGSAYIYDSHSAIAATNNQTSAQRPLVNWDVVKVKWGHLADRARREWVRVAG